VGTLVHDPSAGLGLAPYASEYGGRAVQSLTRSLQLQSDPAVIPVLVDTYIAASTAGALGVLL